MTEPINQPTTTSSPQAQQFSWSNFWADCPAAYKGGVVVAVVAWFVGLSSASVTKLNGEIVTCNYFDLVKVGGAALLVCLAIAGFLTNARKPRHALPTGLSVVIATLLVAAAALLAVKGFGIALSPCQAIMSPA